jgi:hypothetical protein
LRLALEGLEERAVDGTLRLRREGGRKRRDEDDEKAAKIRERGRKGLMEPRGGSFLAY